jgi:hypothetical protein
MVNVWWSAAVIICYNILHLGETIAAEKYYGEIEGIRRSLPKNQPTLVNRKGQICFIIMLDCRFNT